MSRLTHAPFVTPTQEVLADWVDYNGHLNMAYYNVLFDRALDSVFDEIGIGHAYLKETGNSTFTGEAHVTYIQELMQGDPVRVEYRIIDWDAKRIHSFEEMYHAEKGFLAATSEQMSLHVDLTTRRVAPFPETIQARIATMADAHAPLPRPVQVGHLIGIPRKNAA